MKDVLWIVLVSVLGPFLACLAIWAAVAALWVVTAPICLPIVWIYESSRKWWDERKLKEQLIDCARGDFQSSRASQGLS